ncbi:Hypothetical protein SMAX5B_005688 [Scophthalmus maximus]|uniref:Uncharacterized protein n=1 Tax=Scophthalmus maximus TaxID=52904 RepID=A0A2U9BBC8_SCOMX|nr:Hypothetical protein SMAX5B_005688 [Scophthalmus maximus]
MEESNDLNLGPGGLTGTVTDGQGVGPEEPVRSDGDVTTRIRKRRTNEQAHYYLVFSVEDTPLLLVRRKNKMALAKNGSSQKPMGDVTDG